MMGEDAQARERRGGGALSRQPWSLWKHLPGGWKLLPLPSLASLALKEMEGLPIRSAQPQLMMVMLYCREAGGPVWRQETHPGDL